MGFDLLVAGVVLVLSSMVAVAWLVDDVLLFCIFRLLDILCRRQGGGLHNLRILLVLFAVKCSPWVRVVPHSARNGLVGGNSWLCGQIAGIVGIEVAHLWDGKFLL